ncbi:hypothetical protein AC1031_006661 [Aphanomyces cochlioides]|nr:hypothetical protein AC1031_006661 [Aphanomyces cochlioides]
MEISNYKPSEKVDDDEGGKVSKKGKKKSGANSGNASVSMDGEVHKVEKPVFKESEPLRFRCGYLVAPPPKPVVEVPIADVIDEPTVFSPWWLAWLVNNGHDESQTNPLDQRAETDNDSTLQGEQQLYPEDIGPMGL